jgi:hypothetical protein
MEKRLEYKVNAQIYIHIEGEEINIGIKNVERAIRSPKNSRMYGPCICVKFLEDGIEKL